MSLFVWNLIHDLSGLDDPASSYECHLQEAINNLSQRWLTTYGTHTVLEIVKMALQMFTAFSFPDCVPREETIKLYEALAILQEQFKKYFLWTKSRTIQSRFLICGWS